MAIRSGFFNSVNGDRKYDASRFAEYFASFIGNGVFPNPSDNLQVIANNNMTVTVRPGKAWINGYILINDDDYILTLDTADGVLDRIDRIVVRYNVAAREIQIAIKKGEISSNPTAPDLQRDADAYELALADIYIAAGTTSITQANITDLRLNTELCGIVHGTVEQVNTTTLFNQYLTWLQEKKAQYDNDMINWTSQKQAEFEDWATAQEQDFENWRMQEEQNFNDWFYNIQDILDENVATTILNMIGDLSNLTTTDKSSLVSAINELDDELTSHKNDNTAHQGVPTGAILMWSGSADSIPEGWGLCDGSTYQRVDGNGTITAPDLRNRFIVGAGDEYNVGDTGGNKEVFLTVSQMPQHNHSSGGLYTNQTGAHDHTGDTNYAGSHSHITRYSGTSKFASGDEFGLDGSIVYANSDYNGEHRHKLNINTGGEHSHVVYGYTGYAGSNAPHENRPPYYALCFIIKL